MRGSIPPPHPPISAQENDWGFPEPRVLTFSDDGKELHVVDATSIGLGKSGSPYPLRRVSTLQLHAGDRSAMAISFHDGAVLEPKPWKRMVLAFGTRAQRDRFATTLRGRLDEYVPALTYSVEEGWREHLPTRHVVRFEAARLKKGRMPVVLCLAPRQRRMTVIRVKDIAGYEPGSAIPNGAPVEETVGVFPGRLQLEKSAKNMRIVAVSAASNTTAIAARDATEYEFTDPAERERFCAYMAAMNHADEATAAAAAAAAATGSGPDGRRGAGGAATPSSAPPAAGSVSTAFATTAARSTVRMPSIVDTAPLWGHPWPLDDVKVWVGTYNVSGTPAPVDPRELDKWVHAPVRDPVGPRDLYVFGLQEMGSSVNREGWGQTLARHLASTRTSPTSTPVAAGSGGDGAPLTYSLVAHAWMWEMGIWIFARTSHMSDITSVTTAELPTGIAVAKAITGVQLGNKGAVGASFRWRDTTVAFVNCHLPARADVVRLRKRESDYKLITRKLKLHTAMSGAGLDWVHQHDHVWLLGDMNYRVDLPYDRVVTLYNQRNFAAIVAHDQLLREQSRGRVFVGFHEHRIDFPPTYRWQRKVEEFSWKRGQSPSYTDRVLYRSQPGIVDRVACDTYYSPTFLYGSDHRPVAATFTVTLRRYYTAPAMPLRYVGYPVPTFFPLVDAPRIPVPVILLSCLRVVGVNALTAPAGMFLTIHAPWLEGGFVQTPVISAAGLTPANKDQVGLPMGREGGGCGVWGTCASPVVCAAMMGIRRWCAFSCAQLQKLRLELAEETKRSNARLKAQMKEDKARVRLQCSCGIHALLPFTATTPPLPHPLFASPRCRRKR